MEYALSLEYPHITAVISSIKYRCTTRGRIGYLTSRGLEYGQNHIPFSGCQSVPDGRDIFFYFDLNIELKTCA